MKEQVDSGVLTNKKIHQFGIENFYGGDCWQWVKNDEHGISLNAYCNIKKPLKPNISTLSKKERKYRMKIIQEHHMKKPVQQYIDRIVSYFLNNAYENMYGYLKENGMDTLLTVMPLVRDKSYVADGYWLNGSSRGSYPYVGQYDGLFSLYNPNMQYQHSGFGRYPFHIL